jgi:hypothetical protein
LGASLCQSGDGGNGIHAVSGGDVESGANDERL